MKRTLALWCVIGGVAGGCGGGSQPTDGGADGGGAPNRGACSTAACGGDLVGTWVLVSWCGKNYDPFLATCDVTIDDAKVGETGTLTFARDATFTASNVQQTGTELYTAPLPYTCTMPTRTSCADVCQAVRGSTWTGAADATHCTCQRSVSDGPSSNSGTYSTTGSGGLMMTFEADTSVYSFQYCVQNDTLVLNGGPADEYARYEAVYARHRQ